MKSDFKIFKEATNVLDNLDIKYVVFGGIAIWAYGRQRLTKDIDLLIKADDADKALLGLLKDGWTTKRTDEKWLYQANKDHIQVDLIFQVKGDFALTHEIEKRSRVLEIEGYMFNVISPEDLILIKVHAIKEIRPADWYDALSIIKGFKGKINWNYFVEKSLNSPERVLSFLLFAHGEDASDLIPMWVIKQLSIVIIEEQKAA